MYTRKIYVAGIGYRAAIDKFRVRIMVNGKQVTIGLFSSFDDAVMARLAAEDKYDFRLVQWLEKELNNYNEVRNG
jgi:hypothetical protein